MPTYEYACGKCGHEFEIFQSMKDKPLTLAMHEVKGIVSPSSVEDRAESIRPFASTILSVLGPFAGPRRLSRWLRYASFGLTALRVARDWRRPR